AELHIERNVRFLGLRRDVPNLMSAADAFVMSSVLEGLPMVLLEAGAAQLPTIATTVGGNAEVVVEGETGFLIPPSNTERLAGAMVAMMALGEGRRRRMGANAYRRVADSFSIEHSVDSWEELYINTLQSVENCSSRSRGSICAAKS
ncbi:MAG: glycosyltransferase, partial [Terracidiphilus sp.]